MKFNWAEGPFTLFAPTNEAFRSLPSEALARLMANPAELKRVLAGHVTKGTYFLGALDSKDSGTDSVLPTLDGGSNKIMINGRSIFYSVILNCIFHCNLFVFLIIFQLSKWTGHQLWQALTTSWQRTVLFTLFPVFWCPTKTITSRFFFYIFSFMTFKLPVWFFFQISLLLSHWNGNKIHLISHRKIVVSKVFTSLP